MEWEGLWTVIFQATDRKRAFIGARREKRRILGTAMTVIQQEKQGYMNLDIHGRLELKGRILDHQSKQKR